ncbi:hypothetical protein [Ammoniphilus sp. CFH 90114]|uniref:hypothetical protein n=1 Tax=Ammoniphilus sp. CFH 90114 TaxID=2493665 RepID=UPI00100E875E|nr:hypothetical protein [Ammoniphilus sp. CFH 90114]RXT02769.1 hypothetical protein EIZ39_24555 [Ammoniphilus sp. CFH 90114]
MDHSGGFIDETKRATLKKITEYFVQNCFLSPFQWLMLEYLLDKETLITSFQDTVAGRYNRGTQSEVKGLQAMDMEFIFYKMKNRDCLYLSQTRRSQRKKRNGKTISGLLLLHYITLKDIPVMIGLNLQSALCTKGLVVVLLDIWGATINKRVFDRDIEIVKVKLSFARSILLCKERGPPSMVDKSAVSYILYKDTAHWIIRSKFGYFNIN